MRRIYCPQCGSPITSEQVSAATMMQRGVVNRGVADDQVDQGARDFAERATTGPGL